jgi:hypothetical protein
MMYHYREIRQATYETKRQMSIDYRLDELGWYQFERMCQALLRAKYGAALEAWGGGSDFGRDAYSAGPLNYPDSQKTNEGPFIFQVKFVSGANMAGAKFYDPMRSAVRAEMVRISERRASRKWLEPRFYTLMTNAPLSAAHREQLTKLAINTLPDAHVILHGATDIAASLDDSPSLRMSYPQILGLRDLRQLLKAVVSADVVNRSAISIDLMSRLASVFVATEAYNRTLDILDEFGFAVLTGPPEMGKTATAWMIALARLTSGWEAYDCRGPSEVFKVYDADHRQLFVADDAFGSTEYRPEIASEWAAQLDRVIGLCGPKHWVIWTSRPGPLKIGLERLNLLGATASFPDPMKVQVDASKLSIAEKAQILYRHAKAAKLPREAIELVKDNATAIVESRHFTPLRIKRLIADQIADVITSTAPAGRAERLRKLAQEALQQPSSAMRTSFNVLSEEAKTLLIAMLNGSNRRLTFAELDDLRSSLVGGSSAESIEVTAGFIDDHFIRVSQAGN